MTDLWGPLAEGEWRRAPVTSGRPATEADVFAGRAVFFIPSGSQSHKMALPICGLHHDLTKGKATPVVIIQAEDAEGQTILGVRLVVGGNMVCTAAEVEIVSEPDARFFET